MSTERRIGPARHDRIAEAREAERAHNEIQHFRAARTVADHADSAEECSLLLDMLGLDAVKAHH